KSLSLGHRPLREAGIGFSHGPDPPADDLRSMAQSGWVSEGKRENRRSDDRSWLKSEITKRPVRSLPPSKPLTGQASPRRTVCAPTAMTFSLYRRPLAKSPCPKEGFP